jgi:hypothetical protein
MLSVLKFLTFCNNWFHTFLQWKEFQIKTFFLIETKSSNAFGSLIFNLRTKQIRFDCVVWTENKTKQKHKKKKTQRGLNFKLLKAKAQEWNTPLTSQIKFHSRSLSLVEIGQNLDFTFWIDFGILYIDLS